MKRVLLALMFVVVHGCASGKPAPVESPNATTSKTPTIDRYKRHLGPEDPAKNSKDFTQKIKSELEKEPEQKNYIEALRAAKPDLEYKKDATESFTATEKAKLSPESKSSAISDVKAGQSDLSYKPPSPPSSAFGLRLGISQMRRVDPNPGTTNSDFTTTYGHNKWVPDATLSWEHQFLRQEGTGSIAGGIFLGTSYYSGRGSFEVSPKRPGGGVYEIPSDFKYRFFVVPIGIGPILRLSKFYWLQPHFSVVPSLIGYVELRSDDKKPTKGYSKGYQMIAGINIPLDKWSTESITSLSNTHSVKHYYLSVDYHRLATLGAGVNFETNGAVAGVTFEY